MIPMYIVLTQTIPAKSILHWLNIARTKPQSIADIIKEEMGNFIEDKLILKSSGLRVIALEGKSAYLEAIKFL